VGRRVIRSVSLPSEETDLYFSVTDTVPLQPFESHERLPPAVLVGVPLLSDTITVTFVPAHTGMRDAVVPREPGSTMFPVISCDTFGLLLGLWPFPIVLIVSTPQRSVHPGSGVGVGGVAVGGVAVAGVAVGGVGVAVAGVAVGGVAVAGVAVAGVAVGGVAVAGVAVGGVGVAVAGVAVAGVAVAGVAVAGVAVAGVAVAGVAVAGVAVAGVAVGGVAVGPARTGVVIPKNTAVVARMQSKLFNRFIKFPFSSVG
jgi:hypothetical protein